MVVFSIFLQFTMIFLHVLYFFLRVAYSPDGHNFRDKRIGFLFYGLHLERTTSRVAFFFPLERGVTLECDLTSC
uniref:Uncharacterized protein n=1 Tax=Oryza brachyantha TaxID=4533 RepID=J3KZI0_ORYBR